MEAKRLKEQDWQAYRALRLEALSLHEDVYGNSFKTESSWDDSHWQAMFQAPNQKFFGLFDADVMVGIGAVFTDRNDKFGRTALLAGGYIQEPYRGQGYSHLLYAVRIGWAVECGLFDKIAVGHRAGNEASRSANQNFGFFYKEREIKQWGDGSYGEILKYERRVS